MRWILFLLASSLPAQTAVAITGATVIDGTGGPPRKVDVLIRGERIAAVGEGLSIPADARRIDASGKTLLPGLFDLHTHAPYSGVAGSHSDWGKNLKAYLACGVTSLVDFGLYPEMFEPLRRLVRDGVFLAPRLHLAARFSTPGGHGAEAGRGDFFTYEVLTPEEAHFAMKSLLASYKPDVIKVFTDGWRYGNAPDMTSMHEGTLKAIVDDAHKAGLEVLTHTVTLDKAKIAARAGVDALAHGVGDEDIDEELIGLMRGHRMTYVSTLAVYEPAGRRAPPPLELFDPLARELLTARTRPAATPPSRSLRWIHLTNNIGILRDGGIQLAVGTDAGVTGTYHGISTLREIELLVDTGLAPLQAIQAATLNAARALHVESERGTIEEGKLADLVLINGRPDMDIADIRKTEKIWLGGREIDRAALLRDIATDTLTPIPPRKLSVTIDDFEHDDRTSLDTLRVNQTDPGNDHTKMLFGLISRTATRRAMSVSAHFAVQDHPYGRLVLPLTPGAIEPGDASAFRGIQFDARGQGEYRLLVDRRSIDARSLSAKFQAKNSWHSVRIPFSAFEAERGKKAEDWERKDLLSLAWELSGEPGEFGWLEVDRVRFYR